MLSNKTLEFLEALFSEKSNLQLPVAVAEQIMEIRKFAEEELKKQNAGK